MLKYITNFINELVSQFNKIDFVGNFIKKIQDIIQDIIKNIMQNNIDNSINVFVSNIDTDLSHITSPCNIILSPVFYWIRIEELPVKNAKGAKKIAPSCFSSHIPDDDYKYLAIKKNDSFVLFAFNEQNIIDTLEQSNIDLSLINKVYFAQNEFSNDITLIDDNSCLYKKNDMYLILPKNLSLSLDSNMDNLEHILRNISLSKHNILISLNKGVLSDKSLNILSVSFVAIAIVLGIEYFILKNTYKDLLYQEQNIVRKYKIPKSSLQLRAIKSSLNKKLKAEIKVKENIQNLFDIPLKGGDFFKDIAIVDNRFFIIMSLKDIKNAEVYKEYLINYFSISALNVEDDILTIKGGF